MQVVILAAGVGRRLSPLTNNVPKCLVEVNGTPIIVQTLDALTKYNLNRIIIIIGHLGSQVKKRLGKEYNGVPITYIENHVYSKTNNIYSLWLARNFLNQDTILMECDIFFEPKVIKKLFQKRKNITLVDKFLPFMDGTFVEVTKDMKISRMVPARDQTEGCNYSDKYKTLNIYSLTKKYLQEVFVPSLSLYIKTHSHNQYYELILGALIYLGNTSISAVDVGGSKWAEVDDFVDLERAEAMFINMAQLFKKVDRAYGGYWRYDLMSCWVETNSKYLAIGNGACEIISILKREIVRKITFAVPSFNEYEAHLEKDQINYYTSGSPDFSIDVDKFIASVKKSDSNAALIINPDIPSAQFLKPSLIRYLAKKLSHLDALIVDESFIDFAFSGKNVSMMPQLENLKNLIIVRSLSKDVGIPGIRLGFAASANKDMIALINTQMPIWNINSVAEYCLSILPKYRQEYRKACARVIEDRDYFYSKLVRIPGIKVYPSSANFMFVELKNGVKSDSLKKHMFIHANMLIKDCSNKRGLRDRKFIRISVRAKEDIDAFLPEFVASLKSLAQGENMKMVS